MQSREDLEKRVAALEKQLAAFKAGGAGTRGIRRRARIRLAFSEQ